ncbi:MAG TPA: VirB4 family type IV secretion/conjugal transfer ATPase [Steroidobacteraceae bacterium]|nr:VirB4 family type IV secretion/conjugal transfer ATPase [Steroidobacteraceae bacterium]
MSAVPRYAAMRRELAAAERIPYTALVADDIVRTAAGDYAQVFKLAGASFESADDVELNTYHERLNVLWRNLASPQVALWSHVVRRRERIGEEGAAGQGFAGALEARYRARLAGETLMVNELYLALIYRPAAGMATSLASRLLSRAKPEESALEVRDALDACEKLGSTLRASLGRYEPETLGVYREGPRVYSRLLEFLNYLVSGESRRVVLPRAPVNQVLASARLLFGFEAIEYRLPDETRVGAMLGIKEYPTPSAVGMLDRLLSAPFPFVLTQSFTFLTKGAGQALLQRQRVKMANAGDFAISQAEELVEALDALTSSEFVMGEHHFSLQVLAETPEGAGEDQGERRLKGLNDRVALARSILADTGMSVAREDLALEAAFWAQLPGNFSMRPRKAAITSRNFAAMVPFHNYPAGRATGNHWGDALTPFETTARSAFHFSLHASDPTESDGGSRRDTGHTFICGPTGSGKSVLIAYLAAVLSRRGVTQILFDKDRGLEILVRALGGTYQALKSGEPTGFNPLQLPVNGRNLEFLKAWLRLLVRGPAPLSAREQADLEQALRGTLVLQPAARRLSRLIEFLDPTDPEGVHARLSRWCESTRGEYAQVFDNPDDKVVPGLAGKMTIGFDVTDFLEHEDVRAPLTLYLFHLVRGLLDGRRLVCWMDEFWRLLADPAFEQFAKDGPKTWRKLNGVMCLATQSASDVLESRISRTIIEQTPTKIFFPNPEASLEEYTRGFGLTEREFHLVKEELEPGARTFLIKQGHQSVACQLNLKGFDAELAVLSGRAGEIERLHRIMEETGNDPSAWLSRFMGERRVA